MNENAGVSAVLTTHYIEEVDHLCDRVAIVDDGQTAAIDSPASLKETLGGDVVSLAVNGPSRRLSDRLDEQDWVIKYDQTDTGVNVTVERGDARIADLVRLADDAAATTMAVDLRRPNPETVFLSLTGATIEEREADTNPDAGEDSRNEQTERSPASPMGDDG